MVLIYYKEGTLSTQKTIEIYNNVVGDETFVEFHNTSLTKNN